MVLGPVDPARQRRRCVKDSTCRKMRYMTVPRWKTFEGGTKIRVALWLYEEVGRGGVFTKAQLRAAFPNVEQVDRRMRDLRPEGWVIHTNSQDVSLESDELRLVTVGGRVWERSYRSAALSTTSDAERRAIMRRDNFACVFCGVSAGEPYEDDPARTAVLTVVGDREARGADALSTVCSRCRGASSQRTSADAVLLELKGLDPRDQATFRLWLAQSRRIQTPLDRAWLKFLRLPPEQRKQVDETVRQDSSTRL
jgi:hypothetical protein